LPHLPLLKIALPSLPGLKGGDPHGFPDSG